MAPSRFVPVIVILFGVCCPSAADAAEDLNVLVQLPWRDARREMLRSYLREETRHALDRRMETYEQQTTPDQIVAYQQRLKRSMLDSLGPFPSKTQLRPRVVGQLARDGYRIEKILLESRPQFYVSANLYLPSAQPPRPAVLLPCGHSENGKAAEAYQRAAILLAKNGIAVLCYDPIGQGERKQILEKDSTGALTPLGGLGPTGEHNVAGVVAIPLGENLAQYRIWDAIRCLDYLCQRDDIDPQRIGCTGNSGGGLMTSYVMAVDDRILAAAPSCFITTTGRKNESPGPGDAEQNIFGQIAYGLDHPDYLLMRAPKPTLICSATQDYVPIEGAWDSFRQAKRWYTRLGYSERVDLVEVDERHGFSRLLRVAAARWMLRWLCDRDEPVTESEFSIQSDEQLQCSPLGQTLLIDGARSIFDLYREKSEQLQSVRRRLWAERPPAEMLDRIRRLAGAPDLDALPEINVEHVGTVRRKGTRIEKIVLHPEKGIVLPSLVFVPEQVRAAPVLYINGDGKDVDALENGPIDQYLRHGRAVMAVDLRGYGETQTKRWRFGADMGENAAESFIAYMLGRSLVGMRTGDVLTSAQYLRSRWKEHAKVELVGLGRAGPAVLHAAACEPQMFSGLTLKDTIGSWSSVVRDVQWVDQLENTVHGALRTYDLPDLVRLCEAAGVAVHQPDAAGPQPNRENAPSRPAPVGR